MPPSLGFDWTSGSTVGTEAGITEASKDLFVGVNSGSTAATGFVSAGFSD